MSSERPEYIEKLRAEIRGYPFRPAKRSKAKEQVIDPFDECRNAFTVGTGNRWMELGQRAPAAKMLFGEFWHKGELCILFADTNVGKSVLAVQIGNSIALGRPIAPFALGTKRSTVLYIDFELTAKQFYKRYAHPRGNYSFTDKFLRAQYNPGIKVPDGYSSFDEYIIAGIEYKIRQVKADVLIIDNITCLRGGTENATIALNLMQNLKALKTDLNLSILVLAHTPKKRNPGAPISADDLHGSKLLINFADSAFSIGKSTLRVPQCDTKPLCYLKQIKQRNTAQLYGEDNVCLCRIQKPGNFLRFHFTGNSPEALHLRTRNVPNRNTPNRDDITKKIAELSATGLTQRQISRQLGVSLGKVNKLLRKVG